MQNAAGHRLFGGNWLRFYVDPRGRATRADYNLRGIVLILIGSAIAAWLDTTIFTDGRNILSNIWNYIAVLLTIAITSRRLHDFNFSGWWQVPFQLLTLGIMVALDTSDMQLGSPDDIMPLLDEMSNVNTGVYLEVLAVLGIFLAFLLLLSTKHGTKGPNKYGPDPLKEA